MMGQQMGGPQMMGQQMGDQPMMFGSREGMEPGVEPDMEPGNTHEGQTGGANLVDALARKLRNNSLSTGELNQLRRLLR